MNVFNGKVGRLNLLLFSSLACIFLIPSLVFVGLSQTSLSVGVVLSGLLVSVLNIRNILIFRISSFIVLLVGLVLVMGASAIVSLVVKEEIKPVISLVIIVVLMASIALGRELHVLEFEDIRRSAYAFIMLLLVLGWLSIVWTPPVVGYSSLEKPVFPYSEESHYALALGMLACGQVYVDSPIRSFFVLLNMMLLSVFFPNLTLLVFFVVAVFVFMMRLRPLTFWLMALLVLIGVGGVALLMLPNFEYFSSRLDFTGRDNLTTLVFLQGWSLAWLNLLETNGLGLGFQMLGEVGTVYPNFTERITDITGREFNTSDGGLLAAKIIAEFGWLGVGFVATFLLFLLRFSVSGNYWQWQLRCLQGAELNFEMKRLMMFAYTFSFLVEMFLRGYGYFSPGVFWLLAVIYSLSRLRARRRFEFGK